MNPAASAGACTAMLVCTLLLPAAAAAEDAPAPAPPSQHHIDADATHGSGVGRDFSMVEKLLIESSSAHRILQSDNDQARQLHQQALQALRQARAAQDAGDGGQADQQLQQAKRLFFQALQLAGAGQAKADQISNFDQRLAQVRVMLDAYRQVVATEPALAAGENLSASVAEQLRLAAQQARGGDLALAGQTLEQAWLSLRLALVKLRDGKTLVRSLEFAGKEEEYAYELDRNDTHFMLLQVLTNEKNPPAATLAKIRAATDQARSLRQTAESQARSGEYDTAIKTLDDSTREIIRAIRAAGIYIPG